MDIEKQQVIASMIYWTVYAKSNPRPVSCSNLGVLNIYVSPYNRGTRGQWGWLIRYFSEFV